VQTAFVGPETATASEDNTAGRPLRGRRRILSQAVGEAAPVPVAAPELRNLALENCVQKNTERPADRWLKQRSWLLILQKFIYMNKYFDICRSPFNFGEVN
jgi:hypothetical protein